MRKKRKAKHTPREPVARPAPDPDLEVSPEQEDLILRLLATAMGLPRVCLFKTCRRRKRCLGEEIVCAEHHRGLVEQRIQRAIALFGAPPR
jgi:hypothetical protein